MTRIAIIGAGLSGLVAARALSRNHEVTLFEKSRGVGGRIATRYADDCEFDHGAQFFIARSPEFQTFLRPLIEQNVVAIWSPRFAELERNRIIATRQWGDENPHYVGVPGMNAIGKQLASKLDVRLRTQVAQLERAQHGWSMIDDKGSKLGEFDWVIATQPAPQTNALLAASTIIRERSAEASMHGCFALMLAFERAPALPWQAALVHEADISWISVNSSKPGREGKFTLVIHSTNAWAQAHIDDDDELITAHLLAECAEVTGIDAHRAQYCSLQRWRYANIQAVNGPACCVDPELQLAACGDWFIHGRVEAAFTSATALVDTLEHHL